MIESSKNSNITGDVLVQEDNDSKDIEDESLAVKSIRTFQDIYNRCSAVIIELETYVEAFLDENWRLVMDAEMSMIKNDTWILVDRPTDQNLIGVKWIFKTELNPDGSINKFKAILVVKGYV